MALFNALTVLVIGILVAFLIQYKTVKDKDTIVTDTLEDEYDYIVVGAGSAGSVVAARLAEDSNNTVLLLEAGDNFDESPLFQMPHAWLFDAKYNWGYYTESQEDIFQGLKDKRCFWPRGKVVGGSSTLKASQYSRGSPFDYGEWAANGCVGWDYKSVLPYFLKSEDMQVGDLKSSPYHSTGGPLAVSHNSPTELTNLFLNAGQELGYDVTDYNGVDQEGFSVVQNNVRNGVRINIGREYLGTKARANLHLGINSIVTKVEIRNLEATGVFYIRNHRKQFVKARKEVVLSGGTINSPQLLMLSGVGPKKHLEEIGIPVMKDLPVGQFLKDHQLVLLPSRINASYGFTQSIFQSKASQFMYKYFQSGPLAHTGLDGSAFLHLDKTKRGKTYPDIQLMFFNQLFTANVMGFNDDVEKDLVEKDDNQFGFTTIACTTRPKSVGTLELRSTDPFDPPVINPGYFQNNDDIKTLIGGIRIWEKLTQTKTFQELGVDINQLKVTFCSQHEFRSDAFWECYIRHTAVTEYHHTSTCRMGPKTDELAVVDLDLRVRGINMLRVVDASVFPDVPSGNTNAPTIMIGEKVADLILGIDSVKEFKEHLPM